MPCSREANASDASSFVRAPEAMHFDGIVPGTAARDASRRPAVLVLNRSYWPDAEATGQLLTELCEDLAKDFEITVLAGRPNQNPAGLRFKSWGAETHQGVTIRRVPHLNLGKRSLLGRGLNMLTYLVWATAIAMFLVRPEVVIVQTDPFLLPLLGRCLQWRHKCRLVVYLQDIYPDIAIALGKVRDGRFTRALRRWLFAAYRRADRVIVLGADMRALLIDAGLQVDHITSLSNWVDTTRIYPIRTGNAFRLRERLDGQFVVMYSGNMGLCQNLDEVLEAANRLRERKDIQFVMIGDGASRARLENIARENKLQNVRFRPYQSLAELAHSLSAADLHLVPLDPRVTGCLVPSKLYGILAAGVPALVIADERSEASQIVRESGVGRVVSPRNHDELAQIIDWCAGHRSQLQEMGLRARRLAEQEYDRKTATGRFAQLLKDVLSGGPLDAEKSADLRAFSTKKSVDQPQDTDQPRVTNSNRTPSFNTDIPGSSRIGFLKGKRIIVIGGAGFLGRPVCRALERFDPAEIVVPRSAQYDLRDRQAVRALFFDANPQVVVHLTAVGGGIVANRDNPDCHFYENSILGRQLMEEARLNGVEKFVSVATGCSSPKFTEATFQEERLWDGYPEETNAPYGLAEKMLLMQSQAYRQQYGLNTITLLPTNLYGPRDNFDAESSHVIAALIHKAVEARDAGRDHIDVWGTGTVSREFLFVRDAAEGIALATAHYSKPEPVNIGSGPEITIKELAGTICDLAAFSGELRWDHTKPDGQPRRCLDVSRAEREFGFTASTRLRDGLIETLAWYERHRSTASSKNRSAEQVRLSAENTPNG
jgi:GDP-L-fucose synthase